jgi:hypothetical protein
MLEEDPRRKHPKWGSRSVLERKEVLAKRLKRLVKAEDPNNLAASTEGRTDYMKDWGMVVGPLRKDGCVTVDWKVELHEVSMTMQIRNDKEENTIDPEDEKEVNAKLQDQQVNMEIDELKFVAEIKTLPNKERSYLRVFCTCDKDSHLQINSFRMINSDDAEWIQTKADEEKNSWLEHRTPHRVDNRSILLTTLPDSIQSRMLRFVQ